MNESVYYRDRYWNEHALTLHYLCQRIDRTNPKAKRWWQEFFLESYLHNQPRNRALIMNCGNGWVERELYDKGFFREAVAFDFSEEFVSLASKSVENRRIDYICADCNEINFEADSFDLVINVAAMHHVQFIDRMHRRVAKWLNKDGMFLNFDYIGPHRNQYSEEHFNIVKEINQLLPLGFRAEPLLRPEVRGMLEQDPTEAIHSELTLSMFDRYFIPLERKMLGGGIAYPIMHNNAELYWEDSEISLRCVEFLLQLDEVYTITRRVPSLFAFYVGIPRKELFVEESLPLLRCYEEEENEREAEARANGGMYYV